MNEKEFMESEVVINDKGIFLGENKRELMRSYEKQWIKDEVKKVMAVFKRTKHREIKSVLEIGFGLGYTADEFQKQGIERHVIIEAHPKIYDNAEKWSQGKKGVKIIHGFVQTVSCRECFDLIFDDRQEMVYIGRTFPYINFNFSKYFRLELKKVI